MTLGIIDHHYLKGVLGKNNHDRLIAFDDYKAGWDGANSRPISRSSVLLMQHYFLKFYPDYYQAPDSSVNTMSIFMTHEGNVVLNWKDDKGALTELEFLFDEKTIESFNDKSGVSTQYNINLDKLPRYYPTTTPKLIFTHDLIGEYYDNWVRYLSKQNV